MKMKHTVKFRSGSKEVFEFKTIAESDKALRNAVMLNRTFNTIKCIWIEPINQPWKRERIDFQGGIII